MLLLRRLASDESGQDVIEYALIAALVAVASIPAVNLIEDALRTAYLSWGAAMLRCWRMPAPGSGGGC